MSGAEVFVFLVVPGMMAAVGLAALWVQRRANQAVQKHISKLEYFQEIESRLLDRGAEQRETTRVERYGLEFGAP